MTDIKERPDCPWSGAQTAGPGVVHPLGRPQADIAKGTDTGETGDGCPLCYHCRRLGGAIWGIPVKAFYETAIACGGRGDGEPGERQAAVTTYFGAFIRDLDGNKIEAVTFWRMATL